MRTKVATKTTATATTKTPTTTPTTSRLEIPCTIPISRVENAIQRSQRFANQADRPLLMLQNYTRKQCSLNSALNAILTPALTKFFTQLPDKIHPLLSTMRSFARSKQTKGQSVNTLLAQLALVVPKASEFQKIKVHDSQEFLINLMEGIEKVLDSKAKAEWKLLTEIDIEEEVTCASCRNVLPPQVQPQNCLQLNVVDEKPPNIELTSLQQCLDQKFSDETIDDWKCVDGCGQKGAIKKTSTQTHSKVLMVHLCRFKKGGTKLVHDIVHEDSSFTVGGQVYQITGLINHLGDSHLDGHYNYTALSKHGAWLCNDNAYPVSRNTQQVQRAKREAYVLVCEKMEENHHLTVRATQAAAFTTTLSAVPTTTAAVMTTTPATLSAVPTTMAAMAAVAETSVTSATTETASTSVTTPPTPTPPPPPTPPTTTSTPSDHQPVSTNTNRYCCSRVSLI